MFGEVGDTGILKIGNEEDRIAISGILYKNGYTVQPVKKKVGKRFEYYIKYTMLNNDMSESNE